MKNISVTKNTIFNILTNFLKILLPLITIPYVSRILGPSNLGKINFMKSFLQYFIVFASLGIPWYANREISKVKNEVDKRSKLFFEIQSIKFITIVIISIIYFFIIYYIPSIVNNNVKLAYYFGILIFISFFDVKWFFQGMGEFGNETKSLLLSNFIYVPLVFLFIKDKNDIYKYTLLFLLSKFLFFIILTFKTNSYLDLSGLSIKKIIGISNINKHLNYIGWFFASQIAVLVYTNLDNLMIGYIQGEKEVGFYFAANRLIRVILPLVTSAGAVLLAKISSLNLKGQKDEINYYLKKSTSLILFIAIPAMIGLFFMADHIIPLLFGAEYNSILTLKILSPLLISIGLSNVYGFQILLPFNKEKQFSLIIIMGAIINITLNLILINSIGYNGAAISTLVSETLIAFVEFLLIKKIVFNIHDWKQIYQFIISSMSMAIFIFVLKRYNFINFNLFWDTIIIIVLSISIYFLSLILFKNKTLSWLLLEKLKINNLIN